MFCSFCRAWSIWEFCMTGSGHPVISFWNSDIRKDWRPLVLWKILLQAIQWVRTLLLAFLWPICFTCRKLIAKLGSQFSFEFFFLLTPISERGEESPIEKNRWLWYGTFRPGLRKNSARALRKDIIQLPFKFSKFS